MPNVVRALKQEIARIAKKEAKAMLAPVHKSAVGYRTAIADLKRRIASLEKARRELSAKVTNLAVSVPAPAPEPEDKARITAQGMKSLRKRLGLSGDELARLVGVTGQAVYAWERGSGALRLRTTTRAAVLSIRGLGAREARQRLAEMKSAEKARKPVGKRGKAKGAKRRK